MNPEPEPGLNMGEEKLAELEAGPMHEAAPERPRGRGENAIVGWTRAVVLGARDTAADMLQAAREGAHEKSDRMWADFYGKRGRRQR